MRKSTTKLRRKKPPKRVLALPDLEQSKAAVLNSLTSVSGQRTRPCDPGVRQLVLLGAAPRIQPDGRPSLPDSPRTATLRPGHDQSATRRDTPSRLRGGRCWSAQPGARGGHSPRQRRPPARVRLGNWLTLDQGRRLLTRRIPATLRELRNRAMLAVPLGCGLRRGELLALQLAWIQQREAHWVIADLVGKGGHVRTVPMPAWVKDAIDAWTAAASITEGTVFRAISKGGHVWGHGMTAKVLWDVVRHAAAGTDIAKLAPHDLRRTCARLYHLAGGQLDQIQFLLGHVSIQTTERYLGCKQELRHAVNDRMGIEPDAR
jgi:integrase